MTKLFNDLDPYDRLVILEARIDQLEQIQEEIIKNIQITGSHLNTLSQAVNQLQQDYVSLIRAHYALNNSEDAQ